MKPRHGILLGYAAIVAFAVARVRATERVFSATNDEPMHIASGLDWLSRAPYIADVYHPPLERALSALPSFMAGVRPADLSLGRVGRGNEILYSGDYARNLSRARVGNLLFLGVGILGVGLWTARRFGPISGLLAAALFAWLPAVRAHGGLATTDMGVAAMLPVTLFLLDRLLDSPTAYRGLALGVAAGIGFLSKFSFLLFVTIGAALVFLVRVMRRDARVSRIGVLVSLLAAFFVVWAGYRFEIGTIAGSHPHAAADVAEISSGGTLGTPLRWFASNVKIPAPLFPAGLLALKLYDRHGHLAFLLGDVRQEGWWYYFPVALFFKTPLPFLILSATGIALIVTRARSSLDVALMPVAGLAAVLHSSIDVGVRHVLPLYAPLSMVAAYAVVSLWRKRAGRLASVVLAGWMAVGTERSHPDYLPWFNEAAGPHPERILVDSNLDWGQDYLRLIEVLRQRRISHILLLPFGTIEIQRHDIQADRVHPGSFVKGWYAIPESGRALDPEARAGAYRWLDAMPHEQVGKSIRLYRVGV